MRHSDSAPFCPLLLHLLGGEIYNFLWRFEFLLHKQKIPKCPTEVAKSSVCFSLACISSASIILKASDNNDVKSALFVVLATGFGVMHTPSTNGLLFLSRFQGYGINTR